MKPSERLIDKHFTGIPFAVELEKILDEHAEAIERLKIVSHSHDSLGKQYYTSEQDIKPIYNQVSDAIDLHSKPKSLTLEEIEAVIEEWYNEGSKERSLKQFFRDKLQ